MLLACYNYAVGFGEVGKKETHMLNQSGDISGHKCSDLWISPKKEKARLLGGIPGKNKNENRKHTKNSREDINLRWCFLGKQDCVSYVCRVCYKPFTEACICLGLEK